MKQVREAKYSGKPSERLEEVPLMSNDWSMQQLEVPDGW